MLNKKFQLGKIGGLAVWARWNTVLSFVVLWGLFAAVGAKWLGYAAGQAAWAGLLAAALHFVSEGLHHFSHAWAARRTGYPMAGMLFIWVLAMSLYPRDEPELPAAIHIRRAWGGPIGSFVIGAVLGLLAWALFPFQNMAYWLLLFASLENILVFSLGALLPLGFTDGSTLLKYRKSS